MANQIVESESIDQIFIANVLICGSLRGAEEALADAFCNASSVSLHSTVRFALEQDPNAEDLDEAIGWLPVELQRVMRLETGVRRPFVLRTLLGMGREVCAALLGIDGRRVDELSVAAATQLARAATSRAILQYPPIELFWNATTQCAAA